MNTGLNIGLNIGTIFDLELMKNVGIVIHDFESGKITWLANNEILDKTLDSLTDKELYLRVMSDSILIEKEFISFKDNRYLSTLHYYLPSPWIINKVIYKEGNIDDLLDEFFKSEVINEKESE